LEDLTASSLNAFSIASSADPNNITTGNGLGGSGAGNSNSNSNNKINALDLNMYKMEGKLRRQINSGKMNMNLAASALIEYSAKTTMYMNAMVQIQKKISS
jgi:hypothetical protein